MSCKMIKNTCALAQGQTICLHPGLLGAPVGSLTTTWLIGVSKTLAHITKNDIFNIQIITQYMQERVTTWVLFQSSCISKTCSSARAIINSYNLKLTNNLLLLVLVLPLIILCWLSQFQWLLYCIILYSAISLFFSKLADFSINFEKS